MIIGTREENPRNRGRVVRFVRIAGLVLAGLGLASWYFVFRAEVVRVKDEIPAGFPARGFSHDALETLLRRFVTADGRVRYAAWHSDPGALAGLDRYLAAVARYSPDRSPGRFGTERERLAYWINAYNACVIKGVLAHWPIRSVQDVRAPIELKAGMGFFWRIHFVFGGATFNLYGLEHDVIRGRFRDARAHFLLNCASVGCPVLRPEVARGPDLERQLDEATRAFFEIGVRIDPRRRTVRLSSIFDWYREDFLAEAPSLVRWISERAEKPMKSALADAEGYELIFESYDWGLNGA